VIAALILVLVRHLLDPFGHDHNPGVQFYQFFIYLKATTL
jgi:hypothetical protein